MDKAHDVRNITFTGAVMRLWVDGHDYEIDIAKHSRRLADATQEQRINFELSPAGYGINWPDIDEDLSINGLIGKSRIRPRILPEFPNFVS